MAQQQKITVMVRFDDRVFLKAMEKTKGTFAEIIDAAILKATMASVEPPLVDSEETQ